MTSRKPQITEESVSTALPAGFADGVVRGVVDAYDEAAQFCSTNFGPEGSTLRPHLQLAIIERNVRQQLSGVAGVTMRSVPNGARNCSHLVIEFEGLVITISALESRRAIPRHADFRQSYAESSQGELFAATGGDSGPARTKLYLLIAHGPTGASTPAFLDIVPPTNTCDAYVEHARINLLDAVARSANPVPAAVPDEVVAPAAAELRDDVAQEGKQA